MLRPLVCLCVLLMPMVCGAVSSIEIDQFLASRQVIAQIFFTNKNIELSSEAKRQLTAIVKDLQRYKEQEMLVRVEGFASHEGEAQYNLKLSLQRAMEVESYFLNKHNLSVSVFLTGFGEKGKTDGKLIDSRRVDIAIYEKNSAAGLLFEKNGKIERFILR